MASKILWPPLLPLFLACAACSGIQHGSPYRIAIVPARGGQHGIFVMNSDNTGGKLLTPDASAQLRSSSWSPDGKRIAFFSYRSADKEILNKYHIPSHFPLWVMDSSGSNPWRLVDCPVSSFGWAPDSMRMFFVSAYEDPGSEAPEVLSGKRSPVSSIYLLDTRTGKYQRVTTLGRNSYASWSPDSTRLVFSSGDELQTHIYVAGIDGKHVRRITQSPTLNIRPSWSPNGKTIAYLALPSTDAADQETGVFIIDADGTNKKRVSDMTSYEASWSPDGKVLMLQSAGGLFLLRQDGNKPVQLPLVADRPLDAVFTPDGRQIMFRSSHEGDWHLYSVGLDGENCRRVTGRLSASSFCLSPML